MRNLKFIFVAFLALLVPMLIFIGCGPTQPNLIFIAVTPNNQNLSIAQGSTLQFDAVGNYQDNAQADITTSVTWSSSNVLVSTISNSAGSQGLATAISAGTTTISAIDPSTNITGYAILNVL
jgi:trimeric autotransporter adhesin